MAEKPEEQLKLKLPPHTLFPIREVIDVDEDLVDIHKLDEIAQLIRLQPSFSKKEKQAQIARALDLYESLKPADGLEGMLATQMVGTHCAILECLRLAAIPEQTYEARDMNLKHATKLMALYAKQVEALNKHRGKGQQKVTVEHVNVASGGQAIVGSVEAGVSKKHSSAKLATIEHQEASPFDIGSLKENVKNGKSFYE